MKHELLRGFLLSIIIFISIKPLKKVIIAAPINLTQLYQYADPDVQLTSLIFCVGTSADIAITSLKLGTELFLRQAAI